MTDITPEAIIEGKFEDVDGHVWVRWNQTRVSVQGHEIVSTREQEELGQETAIYGCTVCHQTLHEGYRRPCTGPPQ